MKTRPGGVVLNLRAAYEALADIAAKRGDAVGAAGYRVRHAELMKVAVK